MDAENCRYGYGMITGTETFRVNSVQEDLKRVRDRLVQILTAVEGPTVCLEMHGY